MSLAIAYAMRKKKKCHGGAMAEGGPVEDPYAAFSKGVKDAFGGDKAEGVPAEKKEEKDTNPNTANFKKAFHTPGYAYGGEAKREREDIEAEDKRKEFHPERSGHKDHVEGVHKRGGLTKDTARNILAEMREMKHKNRKYLSEGGEVAEEKESGYEPMPCENCGHMAEHAVENQEMGEEEDMIGRIMKKRVGHYSHGGKVANEDMPIADFEEAEYDDLVKDDNLHEHYTAENSGDELGDEQEDEDRHDIVSKIMKSRKKKDRMPRPA